MSKENVKEKGVLIQGPDGKMVEISKERFTLIGRAMKNAIRNTDVGKHGALTGQRMTEMHVMLEPIFGDTRTCELMYGYRDSAWRQYLKSLGGSVEDKYAELHGRNIGFWRKVKAYFKNKIGEKE